MAHTMDDHLERLQKPLVQFLRDFCAIDTSNPPGRNYKTCCEFLQSKLASLGMKTKLYRVPKAQQAKLAPGLDDYPRYNVVGRWDVGARRTLHLTGHYDVVPATSGWRTNPFSPVIKGGRLYARGAADMKGSNTCAIFAVEAMMRAGVTPPWNIELSFTADEETGGEAGLGWLVRQRRIRPDAALLLEGGRGVGVGYAHRGVQWADITVHGQAGHAMNPRNGVNAVEKACQIIAALRDLDKVYAKRLSRFRGANVHMRRPTIMIGGVATTGPGGKTNTIPDRFTFSIDRRVIPEEKISDVRREIRQAVTRAAKRCGGRASVAFGLYAEPGGTDEKHMLCRIGRKAVHEVRRNHPKLFMSGGFNDMRFLTNDGKVPTIGYGAAGKHSHGDDESVALKELHTVSRVYTRMAMSMPRDE